VWSLSETLVTHVTATLSNQLTGNRGKLRLLLSACSKVAQRISQIMNNSLLGHFRALSLAATALDLIGVTESTLHIVEYSIRYY
jgi:hypothetical protein